MSNVMCHIWIPDVTSNVMCHVWILYYLTDQQLGILPISKHFQETEYPNLSHKLFLYVIHIFSIHIIFM